MTITKNVWKAAALLLILALISAVMISGTYAKYTSTYAGEDTALIAKWDIVATGGGIGMSEGVMAPLDLFHHEYDTNITTSDGAFIIAPGVRGEFTLQFKNSSDVAAAIDFEITTKPGSKLVPIEYSLDDFATAGLSLADLTTALNNDLALGTVATGATVTKTVDWRWPWFEDAAHNAIDTPFGTESASGGSRTEYGLIVTASAVQLQPQ